MRSCPDLRIAVTKEDIEHGIAGDFQRCPIARAVRRQYPDASCIHVMRKYITASFPDYRGIVWRMSVRVQGFAEAFDHHLPVKPITFTAKFERWF